MAVTINASTTAGLVQTADTSGVLALQTAGTTAVTVDASQNTTLAGTLTTTGITNSGVATATRFNPTGSSVTGNGMYLPAANSLGLSTNGTNAVYIDSSQNVGIGTTPSAWGSNYKALQIGGGSNGSFLNFATTNQLISFNAYYNGSNYVYQTNNYAGIYDFNGSSAGGYSWRIAASGTAGNTPSFTQAMTLDSSGNLLVGTTATASYMDGRIIASATSVNPALTIKSFDAGQFCSSMWVAATTGNNIFANFLTETSPTIRGSIQYNRSGGLIVYNTTSDYRAKTVNGSVQNALAKVALLKPSTGRMSGATEDIDFFVAHELQEVVPSAVTGEKDAVNEDNTPKYQMVDKSALIPLLTKAIQELKTINDTQAETINALTARIVALEK